MSGLSNWEIEKIENQVDSLKKVIERYAESVENLDFFHTKLKEHGIIINIEESLLFSPERTLQVARFKVLRAEDAIKTLEGHSFPRHSPVYKKYEQMVSEIPSMVIGQRKILESSMELIEEFHNVLEDVYGNSAIQAWAEARDAFILAHSEP